MICRRAFHLRDPNIRLNLLFFAVLPREGVRNSAPQYLLTLYKNQIASGAEDKDVFDQYVGRGKGGWEPLGGLAGYVAVGWG